MPEQNAENGNSTDVLPRELPEFYHERISYKMASDFVTIHRKLAQVYMLMDVTAKEDGTPDEVLAVSVAKSEALEELGVLIPERDAFLSAIIKSIPRSWLVENAPKKIDDGQWLDYVRHDRFEEVTRVYQEAGNKRREDSKN